VLVVVRLAVWLGQLLVTVTRLDGFLAL
jgi:hypothetical protein